LCEKINRLGGLKRYLDDPHHTFTPTTNCDKLSDRNLKLNQKRVMSPALR
jgi:hypothetical protein